MPCVGGVFLWISATFDLRLVLNTLYDTHLFFGNMFFYIIYHYIAISLGWMSLGWNGLFVCFWLVWFDFLLDGGNDTCLHWVWFCFCDFSSILLSRYLGIGRALVFLLFSIVLLVSLSMRISIGAYVWGGEMMGEVYSLPGLEFRSCTGRRIYCFFYLCLKVYL